MSARRFIGPSVAVAVILLLASAVFLRIRGTEEAGAEQPGEADLPDVSATATFRTDVAIPVSGAVVVRDTLVVSVSAAAEAAALRTSKVLAQVEAPVSV